MSDPNSAGLSAATREQLRHELTEAREERSRLAAQLGGQDPDSAGATDRGDAADELQGQEELARMDLRIADLERLLLDADTIETPAGLADGSRVTLRYAGGDEVTLRVVAVTAGAAADAIDVVTVDSPLGQALAGHEAGDSITYATPDGELTAEIVSFDQP